MTQFSADYRIGRPRYDVGMPTGPRVPVQVTPIESPVIAQDPSVQQLGGVIDTFTSDIALGARIADKNQAEADAASAQMQRQNDINAEKAMRMAEIAAKNGAAQAARELIPQTIDEIKNGKFQFKPEDKNDPELAVSRIVREQADLATSGLNTDHQSLLRPAVEAEFDRVFSPRILTALYQKQEYDQKQAITTSLNGLEDRLLLTTDPSQITNVLNEGKATIAGVRNDQLDGVAARAMFQFARDNNKEMVDAFAKMFGSREVDVQDKAYATLAAAQEHQQKRNEAAFANLAGEIKLKVGLGQMLPIEGVYTLLSEGQKNGIGYDKIHSESAGMLSEWNTAVKKQENALFQQSIRSDKSKIGSNIASAALSPDSGAIINFSDEVIGYDENGKPIQITEKEKKDFAVQNLRSILGWNGELGPDNNAPTGWDALTPQSKSMYIRAMRKMGIPDDAIMSIATSMDLSNENATKATKQDIRSVQAVIDLQSVDRNYSSGLIRAANDKRAHVAEIAAIIAAGDPANIEKAIIEAKDIANVVGDNLDSVSTDQAAKVIAANPRFADSPEMIRLAALRARKYEYGAKPKDAYANATKELEATSITVNDRIVPLDTMYTIDDGMKKATQTAAERIVAGKVAEYERADARIENSPSDFTLERIDSERYRVVLKGSLSFSAPRGTTDIVRVSDIQKLAADEYQKSFPKINELPTADVLQQQIAQAEADRVASAGTNKKSTTNLADLLKNENAAFAASKSAPKNKSGEPASLSSMLAAENAKRTKGYDLKSLQQQLAVRKVLDAAKAAQESNK